MSWFDSLVGLWGPDAALRFALGQGPNQPGGGGPSPLMSGTDPNAATAMPTIPGPLAALAPPKPNIKLKTGYSYAR